MVIKMLKFYKASWELSLKLYLICALPESTSPTSQPVHRVNRWEFLVLSIEVPVPVQSVMTRH